MNHDQAVARAKVIYTRSEEDQWELARLTFEHTTGEGSLTLRSWAQKVGFSETHARDLRKTWVKYGEPRGTAIRTNESFNECYAIARMSPERAARLQERAARRGHSVATEQRNHRGRDPEEESPRDRRRDEPKSDPAESARETLRDPKRFREFLREDPKVREVAEREVDRLRGQQRHKRAQDRVSENGVQFAAELKAINLRLAEMLREMLDQDLTAEQRAELLPRIEDIKAITVWMRSYLKAGIRSFEDALDALLDGSPSTKPITQPKRKLRKPKADVVAILPAEPAETEPAEEKPRRKREVPSGPTDPTTRPSRRGRGKRAS